MTENAHHIHVQVTVLLAVHNGARFLRQQLESLRNQELPPQHVVIGDDGSADNSIQIIKDFFSEWAECKLTIVEGPQLGSAANFLSLFEYVEDGTDFAALCDQDDVWLENKLSNAIQRLGDEACLEKPSLYGSATWVCGPDLNRRKRSKKISVDLGFSHALVENYAGGNTMVMNRPAIDLVRKSLHVKARIPVHDWWIYQLITGAGGNAFYDPQPSALYRQHGENQIGDNSNLKAQLSRMGRVLRGDYKKWTEANLFVLQELSHLLTPSNATSVSDISNRRKGVFWKRLGIISTHGLRRQGSAGQAALWLAVMFNRF